MREERNCLQLDVDRVEALRAELGVALVRLLTHLSRRARHEHRALRRTEDFEAMREAAASLREGLGLSVTSSELRLFRPDELTRLSTKRALEQMIEGWVAAHPEGAIGAVSARTLDGSGLALLLGTVCAYQALRRWSRPPCSEACAPPPESIFAEGRLVLAKAFGMVASDALELDLQADREVTRLLDESPALLRVDVRRSAERRPTRSGA